LDPPHVGSNPTAPAIAFNRDAASLTVAKELAAADQALQPGAVSVIGTTQLNMAT
jgi:hypothetical protein